LKATSLALQHFWMISSLMLSFVHTSLVSDGLFPYATRGGMRVHYDTPF
jgi:hypothetical protein